MSAGSQSSERDRQTSDREGQAGGHDLTGIITDCVDEGVRGQEGVLGASGKTPEYHILVSVSSSRVRPRDLEKYFQSNKKSGGGECLVTYLEDLLYRVSFYEESAKQNVLQKTHHTIKLNSGLLILVVKNKSKLETTREPGPGQPQLEDRSLGEARVQEDETSDKTSKSETLQEPRTDTNPSTGQEPSASKEDPVEDMDCDSSANTDSSPSQEPGNPPEHKPQADNSTETKHRMGNGQAQPGDWNTSPENREPRPDADPVTGHIPSATAGMEEMECDSSAYTNLNPAEPPARRHRTDNSREIFTRVTVTLNLGVFSLQQIREALAVSPGLEGNRVSNDEITVTGSFTDVERLYNYLQEQMGGRGNAPPENAPLQRPENAPLSWQENAPPQRPENAPLSWQENAPPQCPENAPPSWQENAPPQRPENALSLSEPMYEYVRDIYSGDIDQIKARCSVDLRVGQESPGNVGLLFTPRGSGSQIDEAKIQFTDIIQKITSDWTQREVNPPNVQTLSISDLRRRVQERFRRTLVIVNGDKVILRGPDKEISAAKQFLEEGHLSSLPSPRAVKIQSHGAADLDVHEHHLDIVKKLRSRDLQELQEKYNVKLEERRVGNHVRVSFRAVDGPPDLGPHALQMFLSLVQRTVCNAAMMEAVRPGSADTSPNVFNNKRQLEGASGGQTRPAPTGTGHSASPETHGSREAAAHKKDAAVSMVTGESTNSADNKKPDAQDDKCPICLDTFTEKQTLPKCKHAFCKECLEKCMKIKPVCPICNEVYGKVTGNQPQGTMTDGILSSQLPGYSCKTIQIQYNFPSGTQGENQPNRGSRYHGTTRVAYLPDDPEGREILRLLRKAFEQKLVFTVGDSRTTGHKNCVTWNDIHHKTSQSGGPSNFGYPDPEYLKRVRDELKAKGIE